MSNAKEANVDYDDDIDQSLEADADAAIGFSEQRAALRQALRALWRGSAGPGDPAGNIRKQSVIPAACEQQANRKRKREPNRGRQPSGGSS
jgi:hypothetical protein